MSRETRLKIAGFTFLISIGMIAVAFGMSLNKKTRENGCLVGILGGALMVFSAQFAHAD